MTALRNFTFSGGGSFRVVLLEAETAARLRDTELRGQKLDSVVAEVIGYLNAALLDDEDEYVQQKLTELSWRHRGVDTQEQRPALERELRDRISYVRLEIQPDRMRDRALLRRNAPVGTFDELGWSVIKGRMMTAKSDGSVNAATLTLSLFRPTGGKAGPNANIFDAIEPQRDRVSFMVDEIDLDNMIKELISIRNVLVRGEVK